MAASVDDFVEILDVESGVDLVKLKEAARHGIPSPVKIYCLTAFNEGLVSSR